MRKIFKGLVGFCLMFVCVFSFSACKSGRASLAEKTMKFEFDIESGFTEKQSFEQGDLADLGTKTNEEWLKYFFNAGIIDWSRLGMPMTSTFAEFKTWIINNMAPKNEDIGKVKFSSEEKATLTYNDVKYDVEMDDSKSKDHYMYLKIYEKNAEKTEDNVIGKVDPGSWDYGRKGKITKHNIQITIEGVLDSKTAISIPLVFDNAENNPKRFYMNFTGKWKFV